MDSKLARAWRAALPELDHRIIRNHPGFRNDYDTIAHIVQGMVDILILGDTNIDVSKPNTPSAKSYITFLKNLGLTQMTKTYTCITNTSKSTIDHCITNREDLYHTIGTLDLGLSDHALIYTNRKKLKIPHTISYAM